MHRATPQIVIVDDNEYLSELLESRFQSERWKTNRFNDGHGALHHLSRKPADVVLLDIQLADRSGFEVLDQIRSDKAMAKTPVIMLTCRMGSADVRRAQELGASAYIVKPFNMNHLVSQVRRELSREVAFLL